MKSATYQAYSEFTAQGHAVRALMSMYSLVESNAWQRRPLTPIVVFMAFSIEAYVNSIGEKRVPFWSEVERLSWRRKVNILHTVTGKETEWEAEPLRLASEVFKIRDKLAHGRSERVMGPRTSDRDEALKWTHTDRLVPPWLEPIDLSWIIASKARFNILMTYLGELFGSPSSDHLLSSVGGILTHDA